MKNYLLTWYGITDLRAALGFENLGGPVLGALRAGDFTDVLILAYTDPSKTNERQVAASALRDAARSDQRTLTRQEEFEIVEAFANTAEGHRLFKDWLRSEIGELPTSPSIRLCTKELRMPNDSKGIYEAVNQAMNLVAQEPGEKRVTFYLSPGTPVMAFTWAFVALTNPELDIRILASSEPQKPPCEVDLPYELLAPSNRPAKAVPQGEQRELDVIFHLFGEQRMPALLGIKQFTARQNIFVTSGEYSSVVMRNFLGDGAWKEIHVSAFDPMSTKMAVLKEIALLPEGSKVGFNLTGGTKLMFAGALAACRKVGGIPFYFETREQNLIFLHNYSRMPVAGVNDCSSFLILNGFRVLRSGAWTEEPIREQRIGMTNWLWKNRSLIAGLYTKLRDYNQFEGNSFVPFQIHQYVKAAGQRVEMEVRLDRDGSAYLRAAATEFYFKDCPDFAKYLSGGWLEEFVYLKLKPLLNDGLIRDLRIGLEVALEDDRNPNLASRPVQEFDVLFTDGKRLFFVECKAGNILTEYLYKLQQVIKTCGGSESRGILAGSFKPYSKVLQRRIEEARHIRGLFGGDLTNDLVQWVRSQVK